MGRRCDLVVCQCPACVTSNGPRGRCIQEHERRAHLLLCQSQQATPVPASTEGQMEVDDHESINARLFALTLAEEGPDITAQPHPLWNPRSRVQYAPPIGHSPPTLSPDDIQRSVLRTVTSSGVSQSTKKDRRKQRGLKSLDEMDQLIAHCNMKLSLGLPDCVEFARRNHTKMCERMSTISRNAAIVRVRKEEIREKLRLLKARLDRETVPSGQHVPVQYDAGTCISYSQ